MFFLKMSIRLSFLLKCLINMMFFLKMSIMLSFLLKCLRRTVIYPKKISKCSRSMPFLLKCSRSMPFLLKCSISMAFLLNGVQNGDFSLKDKGIYEGSTSFLLNGVQKGSKCQKSQKGSSLLIFFICTVLGG